MCILIDLDVSLDTIKANKKMTCKFGLQVIFQIFVILPFISVVSHLP